MPNNQTLPDACQFAIYQDVKSHVTINVRFEGDAVWLTQPQIAVLFHISRTNIVHHIRNIYQSAELQKERTCQYFSQVQNEGSRTVRRNIAHYNMDMIIAIGYRVNSAAATQFRQWATERRKQIIIEKKTKTTTKIIKSE
jgi:hypothetical protein